MSPITVLTKFSKTKNEALQDTLLELLPYSNFLKSYRIIAVHLTGQLSLLMQT